jgi:hypothetical protein
MGEFLWMVQQLMVKDPGILYLLWALENPLIINEWLPHSEKKTGIWCAISQTQIIGYIFFNYTVNAEVYLTVFDAFVNQMTDERSNNK